MKDLREKKMIKGCTKGNPRDQKMLYELYYGKMMGICQRYTKTRDEAKDVLHEGFIKVFAHLSDYKGEGSLEGWMRKIMVNTSINFYHKQKKLNSHICIDENIEDHAEISNLDEQAFQKMAYDDLLQLIRSLPPAYQTVFNLYVIEGYNHKEISQMLNISEGTSKSNLAKARMKLQKQLTQKPGIHLLSQL